MKETMKKLLAVMITLALVLCAGMIACAESADADALVAQGLAYYYGNDVEQDYIIAEALFRKAAAMGNADAENNLGYMYWNGYGVEKDYNEAFKWFSLAANQNHMDAQNNIGLFYENGYGVEQNYSEAVKWYTLSAEQGYVYAEYNLGRLYFNGYGVEQDMDEAFEWFSLAADQNHYESQYYLGIYYEVGGHVEQDYNTAARLYAPAAEYGFAEAQCSLAKLYLDGKGVEQSYEKAFNWFSLAADQNQKDAQYSLGYMYQEGLFVEKNYEQALQWYRKAAENGKGYAYYMIGIFYEEGLGVQQDYAKAADFLKTAVSYGIQDAQEVYEYCCSMINTESADQEASVVQWGKSHFNNGTMYIYTLNIIPGSMTNTAGKTSGVYMRLYQDKNGFFATVYDADRESIYNTVSTDISVRARLVWYEGTKDEYLLDCQTKLAGSGNVIRLPFAQRGALQGVVQGQQKIPTLILSFSTGETYRFSVPNETNYREVWDFASNYWYIPTYNDDLYTGNDVNPDLVEFVTDFINTYNAARDASIQAGDKPYLDFSTAVMIKGPTGYSDLDKLFDQYWEIEKYGLPRSVDAKYFSQLKQALDQIIAEMNVRFAVNAAPEVIDMGSDLGNYLFDWLFN